MVDPSRPLVWIGSAEKDFKRFPERVQDRFTLSLNRVRKGNREVPGTKPLSHGILKGLGVLELVEDFERDTFRVVYTPRFETVIAILDAFKKKSTSGIATPLHEIRLIRSRYRLAEKVHGRPPHHGR